MTDIKYMYRAGTDDVLYLKMNCDQEKTEQNGLMRCSEQSTSCTAKTFPLLDFSEPKERCELCLWRCPVLDSSQFVPAAFQMLDDVGGIWN